MEFLKRPVAPYLVDVQGINVPDHGTEPILLGAVSPAAAGPGGTAGRSGRRSSPVARSPRMLELLELAETGPAADQLAPHLTDPDPKVRRAAVATITEVLPDEAAALEALAGIGCPPPLAAEAIAALHDEAWQVRAGAARGLSAADPAEAAGPLIKALADRHLDVRKAAVIALAGWAAEPEVAEALRGARADTDADVRAYARRALADLGAREQSQ